MLVEFVGCPNSGKTTTAAMLFAELKKLGMVCEFITEQARFYIAERRWESEKGEKIVLRPDAQIHIMRRQQYIQTVFSDTAEKWDVVVSDSSPLNALLYMTPEVRKDPSVLLLTKAAVDQAGVIFYTPPTYGLTRSNDVNRLHSLKESIEVDKTILPILTECAPGAIPKMISLSGSTDRRFSTALMTILEKNS